MSLAGRAVWLFWLTYCDPSGRLVKVVIRDLQTGMEIDPQKV
jgi:hypothetical protein